MQQTWSAPDLKLAYWPDFLPAAEADALFTCLLATIAWEQGQIRLFGKEIPEPRLSAWYGDPGTVYSYSGKTLAPLPWTPELQDLRTRISAHCGTAFNSVLLNLYRNGHDSMGAHSDDEPELGPAPTIASLSLGAERRFTLRHKREPERRHELCLGHGSLLLMSPPTQAHWKHALPKASKCDAPRINLTFRAIGP